MSPLRRELCAALIAAVIVVTTASRARAAADTFVQFDYQADLDSGCVDEDELRHMVAGHLDRDPFRPDADRRVTIRLIRTEAGFQGRIVWTEADGRQVGQRLLSSRSRDCRELATHVAFTVALQLQLIDRGDPVSEGVPGVDADRPVPEPIQEPIKAPPPNPPPVTTPAPEVPAAPAPSPGESPALTVGAGPELALGIAPATTAAGRLFVGARFRYFSAELGGDAILQTTRRAPDNAGVFVRTKGATAAGCAHRSVFAACALGRLGWLEARGTGVDVPLTSTTRFYEVGVRLTAVKQFGRVALGLHADSLVMLARWNVILNKTVFWSVPRVGGMVGVDLSWRFF